MERAAGRDRSPSVDWLGFLFLVPSNPAYFKPIPSNPLKLKWTDCMKDDEECVNHNGDLIWIDEANV